MQFLTASNGMVYCAERSAARHITPVQGVDDVLVTTYEQEDYHHRSALAVIKKPSANPLVLVWLVHHLHGLFPAAPAASVRLHAAHRLRRRCHQQTVLCTHKSGSADRAPDILARQVSARHVGGHAAHCDCATGATYRHRHYAAWIGGHRRRVSSKNYSAPTCAEPTQPAACTGQIGLDGK